MTRNKNQAYCVFLLPRPLFSQCRLETWWPISSMNQILILKIEFISGVVEPQLWVQKELFKCVIFRAQSLKFTFNLMEEQPKQPLYLTDTPWGEKLAFLIIMSQTVLYNWSSPCAAHVPKLKLQYLCQDSLFVAGLIHGPINCTWSLFIHTYTIKQAEKKYACLG